MYYNIYKYIVGFRYMVGSYKDIIPRLFLYKMILTTSTIQSY